MKKILLFIWQLPQNILGILVILFTNAKPRFRTSYSINIWFSPYYDFGVSLGNFIIITGSNNQKDIKHEYGHQKQSLYLGWLYLLIIGVPSFWGNIWDRIIHRNWKIQDRIKWYYNQPWEKWADKLGNVNRFSSEV